MHQIDRPAGSATVLWEDDAMELFIDADHSGGQFANFTELSHEERIRRNGVEANHFVLAGPPPDEDFFVNFFRCRLGTHYLMVRILERRSSL